MVKKGHPLFARVYRRVSHRLDERGAREHRRELLGGLTGNVIEVGAGNGLNFPHYPRSVTHVTAVEPERYFRQLARQAGERAEPHVDVINGAAEALPVADDAADAVVISLVLCSVPDQDVALSEVVRVLRPGGELRFYEHVLSDDPRLARVQRFGDRTIYPMFAGGCHTSRETVAAIRSAGLTITEMRAFDFPPPKGLPHVLGRAHI